MAPEGVETEELLLRAGREGSPAYGDLLQRHRPRLRRMIASVLDRRLACRLDASDVVQETLADAGVRLPDYLRAPKVPYYPWLRRLALRRLVWSHRFHVRARKRSVARERRAGPDEGAPTTPDAIEALADTGTSPSGQAARDEERGRVREALAALTPTDREVLELRYIEGLSFAEVAQRLAIGLSAVKMRHLRSVERLSRLLDRPGRDGADE